MSNLSNLSNVDTFYRERANGRFEFWTYSEGLRVRVSGAYVERAVARGNGRVVYVK